ncbi:hypothetical protein KY320_02730 [Candidatus Woesearchaeota archaeon]|nr:hypothetical protein [Candidatus Woesearchaeota archaeon]
MRKKRGSLSLSTNAIVVLIIAITILGLALGFTRNIFSSLGENVAAIGQGSLLDNPPSLDDPMTLSRPEVDVRIGNNIKFKIGMLNVHNSAVTAKVIKQECKKGNTATTGSFAETIPGGVEIQINEDVVYSVVLQVAADALLGTHVCTFKGTLEDSNGVVKTFYEHLYINVK